MQDKKKCNNFLSIKKEFILQKLDDRCSHLIYSIKQLINRHETILFKSIILCTISDAYFNIGNLLTGTSRVFSLAINSTAA